jgi:hypothetical protein
MIGVHVRYEDRGYLFPAQVEAADGNLGALAAVEKEKLPLSAKQYAGASSRRSRERRLRGSSAVTISESISDHQLPS